MSNFKIAHISNSVLNKPHKSMMIATLYASPVDSKLTLLIKKEHSVSDEIIFCDEMGEFSVGTISKPDTKLINSTLPKFNMVDKFKRNGWVFSDDTTQLTLTDVIKMMNKGTVISRLLKIEQLKRKI